MMISQKKLAPYFYDPNLKSELELSHLVGIEIDSTQEISIPSNIPVLLSTGEFDPVTPPENTYIVAKYLTNSVSFTFPDNGHWVNGPSCYSEIITAFYKNLEMPTNIENCINETEPLRFVVDVSYNKGITQIGSEILMGKQNQIYIPLGIVLIMILYGFLGFPIQSFINFIKRRKNKVLSKIKFNWLPWIITFFALAFVTLLYFGIMGSIERNYYILGFGILSSWNWIFWLILLILMLLFYSILRRKSILTSDLSKFTKSLILISWSGTLLFVGLLFYWNLLWPFSN